MQPSVTVIVATKSHYYYYFMLLHTNMPQTHLSYKYAESSWDWDNAKLYRPSLGESTNRYEATRPNITTDPFWNGQTNNNKDQQLVIHSTARQPSPLLSIDKRSCRLVLLNAHIWFALFISTATDHHSTHIGLKITPHLHGELSAALYGVH